MTRVGVGKTPATGAQQAYASAVEGCQRTTAAVVNDTVFLVSWYVRYVCYSYLFAFVFAE